MPCILSLAVPGSISCFGRRLVHQPTCLPRPSHCTTDTRAPCSLLSIRRRRLRLGYSASLLAPPNPPSLRRFSQTTRHEERIRPQIRTRCIETRPLSRNDKKSQRQSRPAAIFECLGEEDKKVYVLGRDRKVDLSYANPRRAHGRISSCPSTTAVASESPGWAVPGPTTLYSILIRYVDHYTNAPTHVFEFSKAEMHHLQSKGYAPADIVEWAAGLRASGSNRAAAAFESAQSAPPLFLLTMLLRRKVVRASALGIAMRYLDRSTHTHHVSWSTLKILVIRLLRHARQVWPESIPWIASFFTRNVSQSQSNLVLSKMPSDTSQFSNVLLSLLSLPTSMHPTIYAAQQETAQFHILRFMATCSPPIVVSRPGFRALARTQLAHPKTVQERDWAALKGPSWPPWKVARTAMDEDKGYEYGASRASQILHRLFEAGYAARTWEHMAQMYAGWEVDLSPTIQTRTSVPRLSSQYKNKQHLDPILQAGRIRTTRTRREAWAAFLSHESSEGSAHEQVYLAMFEKLLYDEEELARKYDSDITGKEQPSQTITDLLPGDTKEVVPDSISPLHHVFIDEPVPRYWSLFHRMQTHRVRISGRLLAFLLKTCPSFDMGLDALDRARHIYGGAIDRLLDCEHDEKSPVWSLPDSLFTAFITFLCRFGKHGSKGITPIFSTNEDHLRSFRSDPTYLYKYAYTLLSYYRPRYRPAWVAFASSLPHSRKARGLTCLQRYDLACEIIHHMGAIDLEIDEEIFKYICLTVRNAARDTKGEAAAAFQNSLPAALLRATFNDLVGIRAETQAPIAPETQTQEHRTIPPRIPGPAELTAYVRALGTLRDYEGLYSFTAWLVKHSAAVTAHARMRRTGSQILFRMLVALRAEVDGTEDSYGAPQDLALLIRKQIESVEEWGGWPAQEYVDLYRKSRLTNQVTDVGGRWSGE